MGYVAKLKHGTATLDLTTGRYRVGDDFAPPNVSRTVSYAGGTSANRYDGEERTGDRATNRTWSFPLHILGDSDSEIRRAASDVQTFLGRAGSDSDNALYLAFNTSDAVPEPVWGQDNTVYYEIVDGTLAYPGGGMYSLAALNKQGLANCTVTLTTKPMTVGRRQSLAQAMGGVSEVVIGTTDGVSRGVVVPPSVTNYFTNPVFANSTLYYSGWSAGADVTRSRNTDRRFIPHSLGVISCRLDAGTGASRIMYQGLTLTASTWTISFYAKRSDGAAITSTHCQAYFNNALRTSTYTSVGDGWYRVTYTGTASAAAANYGVGLGSAQSLYVTGFQIEAIGYASPFFHGDMVGCAWTGTAHGSTSTRSTGYLRIPVDQGTFASGSATYRAIVTFPQDETAYGSNPVVFYVNPTNMRLYFDDGANLWVFNDGTNSISGGAAWTAGQRIVLHVVFTAGRLQLYVNGSSVASGVTYTPSVSDSYIYLGTTDGPTNHGDHVIGGFVAYDVALSNAQVLADYTDVVKLLDDNQRVSPVPYVWTKSGTGATDNASDTTYSNFAVISGVPGSAPALTEWYLSTAQFGTWYAGMWQNDEFINPTRLLYRDQAGTADGTASGGARRVQAVGTTATAITDNAPPWATDPKLYRFVQGREFFVVARMKNAGTGTVQQRFYLSGSTIIYGDTRPTEGVYMRGTLIPSIVFPELPWTDFVMAGFYHVLYATNTTASPNVETDYYVLLPRPFMAVTMELNTKVVGRYFFSETSGFRAYAGTLTHDEMNVSPDRYNVVIFANHGDSYGAADNGIAAAMFVNDIYVTPRWELQ